MKGHGSLYKRGRMFYLDYTGPDGVRHQQSSRTSDEVLAGKRLQALRRRVDAGLAATPTERRVTVDDLLDDLQAELDGSGAASARKAWSHMKPLREELGALRAAALETASVRKLQAAWTAEGRAPATINRRLELLRQAYRLAARSTPAKVRAVPYIPLLKVDNARRGFLPRAELAAVLAAIRRRDVDLADYLEWFAWTSQRPGEIRRLEWPSFDRETWTIYVPPAIAKTREGRTLAVSGPLVKIIERRLRRRVPGCDLIFHRVSKKRRGQPVGRFATLWRYACREAGLTAGRFKKGGLTPYDLRRTGLRNIVRATGSEKIAMSYSGHKTRATFDRYNIVDDADQRAGMALVSDYVAKLPARRGRSDRHK